VGMSDEGQFLLATLPPSNRQIRLALGIIAALVVAVLIIAPFADMRLPQLGTFFPVLLTVMIVNDLITSALLLSQFFVVGRMALFVLAISYLFTGLMTIPFMLTYPGAFSPTGLLGAGLQSAIYIAIFYQVAAPLGVIAYALLKDVDRQTSIAGRSPMVAVVWTVAAVVAVVCGLTWIATAGEALLPVIFVDSVDTNRITVFFIGVFLLLLNAMALALLWARWRSVLDLWLIVTCCTWVLFQVSTTILSNARFTVGWYGARCFQVIATMLVLLALLSETTALYAKLARSVARERRARETREVAMDAMAAAVAHEVKQPLAAIANNGRAGLNFIVRRDLDDARFCFESVISCVDRASEVIDGIRSLYKKKIHGRARVGVNELVRDVLTMVDADLRNQRVLVSIELREQLPQLHANRAQLEEVFLNLIMNAIEAMRSVTDHVRLLRISSEFVQDTSTVLVTIEDTGTSYL
jgi:signal transduction histidine kinase